MTTTPPIATTTPTLQLTIPELQPQTENVTIAAKSDAAQTEAPDHDVFVVAPKTEGLEGENLPSVISEFEYVEIEPVTVWFDLGSEIASGTAIATNGKGMMRINWGEDRQSDIPRDRVYLSDPSAVEGDALESSDSPVMPVVVAVKGDAPRPVQPNGLVTDRPACSRWEPEEVQHVAQIQIQGLLKHLEPAELVRAAIVHSGCSLPDVVQVVCEMAKREEYDAIVEVLNANSFPPF